MEMFSSFFFFLICRRKDLSDRGEVFDPVLSCWGLSERLHKLQRERRRPRHRYFQVPLSLPVPAAAPRLWDPSLALHFSLRSALAGLGSDCSQTGAWGCRNRGHRAPRGATSTRKELRGAGGTSGCCSPSNSAVWGGCGQDPGWGKRQGGSGAGGLPGPSREGQAGPSRGLRASRGAGGPRAWGQGGCLFLVRVL